MPNKETRTNTVYEAKLRSRKQFRSQVYVHCYSRLVGWLWFNGALKQFFFFFLFFFLVHWRLETVFQSISDHLPEREKEKMYSRLSISRNRRDHQKSSRYPYLDISDL